MSLWPHQSAALDELDRLRNRGVARVCVTSPTGGGKTRMMFELIDRLDTPTVIYSNRRMLLEQTAERAAERGMSYGVRMAGHSPNLAARLQLSSIQTEESRVYKAKKWTLHHARLVLIDEAHNETGDRAQRIIADHAADGALVVGFTATPLGIGHLYDELVVAGTNSELRSCGAHVVAHHYAPDEPDAKNLKASTKTGEFTEGSVRKAIMTPTIFGRVFEHWKRYNPEGNPSLGFGPGVKESLWFAQQFFEAGIPAAHIDGDKVWVDGEYMDSTQETRDYIAGMSKRGAVKIVWNRFVMREGIDWPWLTHGVLATAFGSLTSYLQAGGRLLRACEGVERVTIQDHGGNWWRHGSLNADREWRLDGQDRIVTSERAERLREKKEPEPIVCMECNAVRLSGPACPGCGHRSDAKVRRVMQIDGTLKEVRGDIFKRRPVSKDPADIELWRSYYFRARKSRNGMTFRQAAALMFRETGRYPSPEWPLMPERSIDTYRRVRDVPANELRDHHGAENRERAVAV